MVCVVVSICESGDPEREGRRTERERARMHESEKGKEGAVKEMNDRGRDQEWKERDEIEVLKREREREREREIKSE